jgi:hypothetical protein
MSRKDEGIEIGERGADVDSLPHETAIPNRLDWHSGGTRFRR